MSSPPKSAGAEKYNVRERLKDKIKDDDESTIRREIQLLGIQYNNSVDSSVSANANECFSSNDESGVFERHESPLRNPPLDINSKKFSPSTPSKGFMGRNIDTELASGRSRFTSSASPSPTKDLMNRRALNGSAPPSANARAMKSWRVAAEPLTPKVETPVVNSGRRVPPGVEVNDYNAQKFYSTKECLFIANLDVSMHDLDIKAELLDLFKQHGTCYVKVQRDKKNMPQAFVQYTCRIDAERAMAEHKNLVMHGRSVRIEWSKANREYHLSSRDGFLVTEEEAHNLLSSYGAIEQISSVKRLDEIAGFSSSGLFVIFENYQSGRDATRDLQDSDKWCVIEHDRDVARKKITTPPGDKRKLSEIQNYALDRNSAFIGNLRPKVNEYNLRELCRDYGKVVSVDIHVRPSNRDGCDVNVFAYVEFTNPEEVKAAVHGLRGTYFMGQKLKADVKKSQEILYGNRGSPLQSGTHAPKSNGNAFGMRMSSPLRASHASTPTPMGQFAHLPAVQNTNPGSPDPCYYQQGPPAYGPSVPVYAPGLYPGSPPAYTAPVQQGLPPTYAAPGNQGLPGPQVNSLNGAQTGTEVAAQPNVNYGPPVAPYGTWVWTQEGWKWAYAPNAPYPFPGQAQGQVFAGCPPPSAGYQYQGHSQCQVFAGPRPASGYPYNGEPHAQVSAEGPPPPDPACPVSPSALYPASNGGTLPPNAYWNVAAGPAACQHGGLNVTDQAYGRNMDIPEAQAQAKADAVVDRHLGDGVMVSPKNNDAANQPCSVSDLIAGPQDDKTDSKAENSKNGGSKDNSSKGNKSKEMKSKDKSFKNGKAIKFKNCKSSA